MMLPVTSFLPRWLLALATLGATLACRQTVDIGSNVIWSAGHETGDLTEWTQSGPGDFSGSAAAGPTVVAGEAHSGSYSVHMSISNVAGLWRQGTFPTEAYYSAWFYLPQPYQTITSWTIMTFGNAAPPDGGSIGEVTILNLRTLPGGEIVLFAFDDRLPYLQLPLAAPPAEVPVMKWFQIEVFYRNANDDTGRLSVWLDGRRVYDITNRPSGVGPALYLGMGNIPDRVLPRPEIYVDDAVISTSRVSPSGGP